MSIDGLDASSISEHRGPTGVARFRIRRSSIVTAGAIRGALTLVQASAITDRWGPHSYGRLNGTLAAPVSALTALAPGVAATLAGTLGSYVAMGFVMAAVCATGGLLVFRR